MAHPERRTSRARPLWACVLTLACIPACGSTPSAAPPSEGTDAPGPTAPSAAAMSASSPSEGDSTSAAPGPVEPAVTEPDGDEAHTSEPESPLGDTTDEPEAPNGPSPARDVDDGAGGAGPSETTPPDAGPTPDAATPTAEPTCSESELRTAPPPGKEMFQAEPFSPEFPFSVHWMGTFNDDPRYISMTSMTDIDNDGDLDFASGQRSNNGGGNGMVWWEYCSADHWVRHYVGTGHNSVAGGNAADVDQDGWVDLLAGDSWYRNPQNPRESEWDRFFIAGPEAEELIVGDVTGDGILEVLYVWRPIMPQFWTRGEDPTKAWAPTELSNNRQQQGGAIGDIDGDGDNDILVGYRWWYRNVAGDGSDWETVEIFGDEQDNPYDEPLTYIGDLDADGDNDFAFCSHFGGSVAWAENVDGAGTEFSFHELATDKEYLHAIIAADFDNDADLDIFVGQNIGPSFIFENDGVGNFEDRQIAEDVRMHEARVGDVDCDGDLDIAGKPWGDPNEGGEASLTDSREHVYLQNRIVDNGGPARFDRGPYEEQHRIIQNRICRR